MKKRLISMLLAVFMVAAISIPFVSAATNANLDTTQKVSITLNCNKAGYDFEVYKIADLVTTTSNPYSVKYDVKVNNAAVKTAVANGNFAEADRGKILDALDKDSELGGATVVGDYEVDEDGNTKTFNNLAQGIYYVRAINFPAGVKSVTNSCFALPYYTSDNGWTYSLDAINLAAKVAEEEPEIEKEITNSTKNDVHYTDVSLGETVNFEITTSVLGTVSEIPEHDFKLNSYVISDLMSKGLTLNQNSFVVSLADEDYDVISTIAPENYTVNVTAAEGQDTTFTVSLKKAYLQTADFYDAAYVLTDFSAVLNKYATTEVVGNPNEAVKLTYTNKNDVEGEVEGNKVFVYTYQLEVHKFDEAGTKLQGAEFALYNTEANAKNEENAIATGVSDANGIVEFKNSNNEVMRVASGKYFVKETKAPDGFNKYTDVIPVEINVTYSHTFANGTYIQNAPEHGTASVDVKNSKTVLPQTGGQGNVIAYSIAITLAAAGGIIFFVARKKKKNSADKAA